MKKETAVEWLVEQLENHHIHIDIKNTVVFQQAKQKEYSQIIEAHYWGGADRKESKDPFRNNAVEYYHQTFDL